MIEGVLVQEMRFVEEEHGVHALGGALLDVLTERVEQASHGGDGREPDGVAELAIEVASPERGIAAVGQAEAGRRNAMAERAQNTGLADAGLANEHDRRAVVERLDERVDDGELRGR